MFSASLITKMLHSTAPGAAWGSTTRKQYDLDEVAKLLTEASASDSSSLLLPVVGRTSDYQNIREAFPHFRAVEGQGTGLLFWGRFTPSTLARRLSSSGRARADREFCDLGTPLLPMGSNASARAICEELLPETAGWTGRARAMVVVVDCGRATSGEPEDFNGRLKHLVADDIELTSHCENVLATLLTQLSIRGILQDVCVACSLVRTSPSVHRGEAELSQAPKGSEVLSQDNVLELLDALKAAQLLLVQATIPAVVNISMGTHVGPHNGISPLEQAIDSYVSEVDQRYVFVSAGNDAEQGVHASCHLSEDAPEALTVRFGSNEIEEVLIEFWWEDRDHVDLQIEANLKDRTGADMYTAPVILDSRGTAGIAELSKNAYGVQHSLVSGAPVSGMRCIAYGLSVLEPQEFAGSELRFILRSRHGAQVHAWLISRLAGNRRDEKTAFVQSSKDGTVTIPATSRRVISVAGYEGDGIPWTHSSRGVLSCASTSTPCWLGVGARAPSLAHFALAVHGNKLGTSFASPRACADALSCILRDPGDKPVSDNEGLIRAVLAGRLAKWNHIVGFGRVQQH